MQAIVLCGGFGTRLQSIISKVPKPMAPVHGRVFLDYVLFYLALARATKIVLCVGYKKESIKKYYAKHDLKFPIIFSEEDRPLGTQGAIKQALDLVTDDDILIVNGDTLFFMDIDAMFAFHKNNKSLLTIGLTYTTNPYELHHAGYDIINRALREDLEYNRSFESFFDSFLPKCFLDDGYFVDIGTPETYFKALEDLKRF